MKTIILLLSLSCMGACTTQAWYTGTQQTAEARCRAQPPSEFDRCMEQVNRMRYEDYEKARKAPAGQ
jgi:hypothetical protein